MCDLGKIMAGTDNLSFYHKVLLPGLLAVLMGMAATQVMLLQSVARLEEKVTVLSQVAAGAYTISQADGDRRLQAMVDAEQNKRMDAFEVQLKSHGTQIYNIRSEQ